MPLPQFINWPSLPSISLKVPIGLGVAELSSLSNAIIRKPNWYYINVELKFALCQGTWKVLYTFEIGSRRSTKFQMHRIIHEGNHLYIKENKFDSVIWITSYTNYRISIYSGRNFSVEGRRIALSIVSMARCHAFAGSSRCSTRWSVDLIDRCHHQKPKGSD